MSFTFLDLPSLGSIQSALDQPIFPGKLVVWLLFMLSIIGWVMILSKALQLWKIRRADREFSRRLRESKTTLELFESGWRNDDSVQYPIYLGGAREIAFQLLGTRNPGQDIQDRISTAGRLTVRQGGFLEAAFDAGYRQGCSKLSSGVAGLRFIAASAALLSMIGCVWTLMNGFDGLADGAPYAPVVGAGLGFLAIGLLVVTPAVLARIAFSIHIEKRRQEIEKFRNDLARLFERKYAMLESGPMGEEAGDRGEPEAGSDDEDGESRLGSELEFPHPGGASREGSKRYHSIRDRLLRPPGQSGEEADFSINPIAQQARAAEAH